MDKSKFQREAAQSAVDAINNTNPNVSVSESNGSILIKCKPMDNKTALQKHIDWLEKQIDEVTADVECVLNADESRALTSALKSSLDHATSLLAEERKNIEDAFEAAREVFLNEEEIVCAKWSEAEDYFTQTFNSQKEKE